MRHETPDVAGRCALALSLCVAACSPAPSAKSASPKPFVEEGIVQGAPGTDAPSAEAEAGGAAPDGPPVAAKARVSVLATMPTCSSDVLPELPYVGPFEGTLADLARCHTAAGSENGVSVQLDPLGKVQAFMAVKGNTACLRDAVYKVHFPPHTCATMLLIVSKPDDSAP